MNQRHNRFFDWLFYITFERHCSQHYNADYEVCRDVWCWLSSTIERYAWYDGSWSYA